MISNTKKGYLVLEAAIFLPVFIIGILTLGYFIKIYSTAENITFCIMDETGHLAAEAYGRKTAVSFPGRVEKRLKEENNSIEKMKIVNFRYLYSDRYKDGLITLGCKYRIILALPVKLTNGFELESHVKCRGFIGKQNGGTGIPFQDMEKNGDSSIVWIFPIWGEKFHKETCRFVTANAVQKVLTSNLKSRYTPCELCRPEELSVGTYVYCFLRAGGAYHKQSCHMVEKYTIEIEREEALHKGYQPCKTCGGG